MIGSRNHKGTGSTVVEDFAILPNACIVGFIKPDRLCTPSHPPIRPAGGNHASDAEPLSRVLCRSGRGPVVVNLDDSAVEKPEELHWAGNILLAPNS